MHSSVKFTARGSLKSQRNASPVDEHRNADDLSVPESMQKFIATKMSEIIARQIEFVDVPKRTATADQTGTLSAVRLLRGSNHLVGLIDEWSLLADETVARPKQRKPTIKRRQIESLNMNANDRINACAVTMDDVCRETADWHRKESTVKRNRRHFEYKSIDGQCYLIEPETEFTKLRKKNNWSENKIKRIDT